jgi:DNA-binding SARP family transcriptional activator
MDLGVLGPLLVADAGRSHVPNAPKKRQVLALLLMHANEVVSIGDCIEELWEHDPPSSAVQTLQTYIMQLRKALPKSAGQTRLVTKEPGYLFVAESDELDLAAFDQTVRQARAAIACDNDSRASALLTQALEMWRGPALADVQIGPILRTRLVGLTESRLSALELRIEADLRLGRHHELISDISMLVERYPMHENLYAQLMLALYRSGRQATALETYQRLRRVLADELGLEPSRRMQHLFEAVLAADPVLDPPAHASPGLSLDLVFYHRARV